MKKRRNTLEAGSLSMMGLALVTVLAILVAPICAPICAARDCAGAGTAGSPGSHCHQLGMHGHGVGVDGKHSTMCRNGEMQATLNGTREEETSRQATQTVAPAAYALGPSAISSLLENRLSPHGGSGNTSPTQSSSSITVLRT